MVKHLIGADGYNVDICLMILDVRIFMIFMTVPDDKNNSFFVSIHSNLLRVLTEVPCTC